ncbi:MAG: hypothetical protein CVU84_02750 [Firmicutes bacterium HGW-Firmicutes-1]|jgi:hypothetical protein|nr:MAG: hypothetical protein CVU84_02750 [Firmicutes bacterium HGW-Firmicutes-1]
MKRDDRVLIRGVGIGVIITTLLFYCVFTFTIPKENTLSNEEIIEKAKDLGMIFISNLENDEVNKDNLDTDINLVDDIDSDVDGAPDDNIGE